MSRAAFSTACLALIAALLWTTPLGCAVCRWWARLDERIQRGESGGDRDVWMDEVDPCPCTVEQVEAAPEIWLQDKLPALHQPCLGGSRRPADEIPGCTAYAYRSAKTSANGAGNQCCYGLDGHLLTSGLSQGSIDRYAPGYDMLRHSLHDVVPFFFCCHLCRAREQPATCDLYMKKRRPLVKAEGCLERPSRGVS